MWFLFVRPEVCHPVSFRFHLTMDTLAFGCKFPTIRALYGLSPIRLRPCRANYKKADSITLPAFCLLDYGLSWKSPSGLSCFSSRLGSFLLSPPLVVITSSLSKRIKYSDQTKSSLHSRYPCQKQCHNRRSGAGDFLWQWMKPKQKIAINSINNGYLFSHFQKKMPCQRWAGLSRIVVKWVAYCLVEVLFFSIQRTAKSTSSLCFIRRRTAFPSMAFFTS